MAKLFSGHLSRLRREAGFKSAYQFYHGNGGRRHFPFTYVHYLRLENAGSLPRPEWMATLLSALRLSPGQEACRALFVAFLRDLLGSEQAFGLILEPLLCRHSGQGPAQGAQALRWMKSEHAVHLTPGQFKAVVSDEATYWCSEVLCNDAGAWDAQGLARLLGLDAKAVRAGLDRLSAAGLARRTAAGRYRSRRLGKLYTFPGRLEGMAGALKTAQRYWDRMRRRRGGDPFHRVELVRAEAAFMRRYAVGLAEAVDGANLGAAHAKGEDTALYLVEAGIRKLMPF